MLTSSSGGIRSQPPTASPREAIPSSGRNMLPNEAAPNRALIIILSRLSSCDAGRRNFPAIPNNARPRARPQCKERQLARQIRTHSACKIIGQAAHLQSMQMDVGQLASKNSALTNGQCDCPSVSRGGGVLIGVSEGANRARQHRALLLGAGVSFPNAHVPID
jgi:hypothetical protein